ncbi:MAG: tyrosine-type recombinase/integrase [Firmicutes bacterium]|nr:tyrosine-type recombinase/integrase [Bacillota bacterium]
MSKVEPIRDLKKIDAIKRILKKENPRNYLFFILGINTGIRADDLLNLKVEDVIDSSGQVKNYLNVSDRNGQEISLFLNEMVKETIKNYLEGLGDLKREQFLFASRKGGNRPISRVHAWHVLNDAAQRVGISSNIGTNTLRKTFAYHALSQGVDIFHLQKIFNHLSPCITMKYIGVTESELSQVKINLKL